jgi:hypothetical protein
MICDYPENKKMWPLALPSPKKTLIWAWVADSRPLYGEPTVYAMDLRLLGYTLGTNNSLKTKLWVLTAIFGGHRRTHPKTPVFRWCVCTNFFEVVIVG